MTARCGGGPTMGGGIQRAVHEAFVLREEPMLSSATIQRIVAHTESGAAAGCPFCKGRMVTEVLPGQKIRMFSGFKARRLMTVTASVGWSEDEFLASYDDLHDSSDYRVNFRRDRFCYDEDFRAQEWMPKLSVDDIDAIEESFVEMLRTGDDGIGWAWNDNCLSEVIGTVWRRRLPIDGKVISDHLKAHGVRKTEQKSIERMFNFGMNILTSTNGREPIRIKAMKPLEKGRYRTAKKADLEYELFGIPLDN